ncbi:hypothetical protein BDP27DRAFT_1257896, partial [Rhodocollybia butyracea]
WSASDVPLVVLRGLGSFQHDDVLKRRLDRIFSSTTHTFLVNTSGTGKTRLLFEGLCLHWGLYLPCIIDSIGLGSWDLSAAIEKLKLPWLPPGTDIDYAITLQNNIHATYRAVSTALLARFVVFQVYLKACAKDGFCHDHRKRWLEVQIFPDTV